MSPQPMRLLIASDFVLPDSGGIARQVELLKGQLEARGHTVLLATGGARRGRNRQDVAYLPTWASRIPVFRREPRLAETPPYPEPGRVRALKRLLTRERIDVVYAYGTLAYSAVRAAKELEVPCVVGARDYRYVCAQGFLLEKGSHPCSGPEFSKCWSCAATVHGLTRGSAAVGAVWLGRRTLRAAQAIQSNSRFVEGMVAPFLLSRSREQPKLRVIPSFDAPIEVGGTLIVDGVKLPSRYIAYVGKVSAEKGVTLLLEAHRALTEVPPLVLVGQAGDVDLDNYRDVIWLGRLPHQQVRAIFKSCTIAVFPSLWPEPFGSVVHEAMREGAAVIGTAPSGHEDIITDGVDGLLVPRGDGRALQKAMETLLSSERLRKDLGRNARERAHRFSASRVVPEFEELFDEVRHQSERLSNLSELDVSLDGPSHVAVTSAASVTALSAGPCKVLVRCHGVPVGRLDFTADGDPLIALMAKIRQQLGDDVDRHFEHDALRAGMALEEDRTPCDWRVTLGDARPSLSVVVTTCGDRMEELFTCIEALIKQSYDLEEILIVDNRPATSEVRESLNRAKWPKVRYLAECKRGLSRARNAGLQAASGDYVAFTDDDTVPDGDWAGRLVAALHGDETVACVTGLILPVSEEASTQRLLQEFGGFDKGFHAAKYDWRGDGSDPLHPYAVGKYGSGANAAFRRTALLNIGGYREELGAGTPAMGGEDLDIHLRIMKQGYTLQYEPAALVRHNHTSSPEELQRKLFGYGVGLSATLLLHLISKDEAANVLSRVPAGIRHFADPKSAKNRSKTRSYPLRLLLLEVAGLLWGPAALLRSLRQSCRS